MNMKNTLLLGLALGMASGAFTQNVGINGNGAAPNASAMLDVVATDKGVLVPRVALTATNLAGPITTPATSLLVYNTATAGAGATAVSPGFYYWDGAQWVRFMNGNGAAWTTLGNAGTTAATNFLGTTDNIALRFRTNNTNRFEMTTNGRLRSFDLGTAALPTYSWNGDPNTGIFSSGADQIDFTTDGIARFRIPNANQVHALSIGTDALPFYSFSSDPNTGLYSVDPDFLSFSTGGIFAATFYPDQTFLHTPSATNFDGALFNSPTGMDAGFGAILAINSLSAADGTGYGLASVNYGLAGYTTGNRRYSFGVVGQPTDAQRSGGVQGLAADGLAWASIGYRTSAGAATYAGVYSTAALVTGAGFSSSNVVSGLAYLGYSDFIGSIIHSEIVGQVSVGKLMASYNIGNEYTSGYSADVITLNTGEKEVIYNNTSTELKIYNDGQAQLTNGKKFIEFDNTFKNAIKSESTPTITVSPMGECNGIYVVEVNSNGFWVKEMMNGNSNVTFSWIAIGKRNNDTDVPTDILDKQFDSNISKVAPNENNPNEEGNSAYWDGEKFVFGVERPAIKEGKRFKQKTIQGREELLKRSNQ
jgi:hypothetical protein